jgi:hypothetical protein
LHAGALGAGYRGVSFSFIISPRLLGGGGIMTIFLLFDQLDLLLLGQLC